MPARNCRSQFVRVRNFEFGFPATNLQKSSRQPPALTGTESGRVSLCLGVANTVVSCERTVTIPPRRIAPHLRNSMITQSALLAALLSIPAQQADVLPLVDTPVGWVELKPYQMSTVGTALSVRIDENGRTIQEESEVAVLNLGVKTDLESITALRVEVAPDKRAKESDTVSFALTGLSMSLDNAKRRPRPGRFVRYTLPRSAAHVEPPTIEVADRDEPLDVKSIDWKPAQDRRNAVDGSTVWEGDLGQTFPIKRITIQPTSDESHALAHGVVAVLDEGRREAWSSDIRNSSRPVSVDVTRLPFRFVQAAVSAGDLTENKLWTVTTRDGGPACAVFVLAVPVRETNKSPLTFRVAMNVKRQGTYGDFRIFATDQKAVLPPAAELTSCDSP